MIADADTSTNVQEASYRRPLRLTAVLDLAKLFIWIGLLGFLYVAIVVGLTILVYMIRSMEPSFEAGSFLKAVLSEGWILGVVALLTPLGVWMCEWVYKRDERMQARMKIPSVDHDSEEGMMQAKPATASDPLATRTIALDAKLLDTLSELARVNDKTLVEQIEDILGETARIYEKILGKKD